MQERKLPLSLRRVASLRSTPRAIPPKVRLTRPGDSRKTPPLRRFWPGRSSWLKKADDYDAIFYPGGHGPLWDLAEDKHSIALIEAFYNSRKPVAAVCHAPAVLRRCREGSADTIRLSHQFLKCCDPHAKLVSRTIIDMGRPACSGPTCPSRANLSPSVSCVARGVSEAALAGLQWHRPRCGQTYFSPVCLRCIREPVVRPSPSFPFLLLR
ncbi:DJ-1/PfpI family protein [Trinickia symbiotica]|nr:DJ-1/PfpI family protein [Trinickia symbiotica]